jgi:DNA helicase-2/ATP-dependent DNA helicase PcrA
LAPDFKVVQKITQQLGRIGNLVHDGRPILGCDVKDVLKIVLDASSDCMLIPAHIWTPWYGLLGSKSGFNSVHEAFEELTPYIYALEKGLSSSLLLNSMVSELDKYTILCNSDAHSVQNLGREANILATVRSYKHIVAALRRNDPAQIVAGIEFFPERGKYYANGHRKCHVVQTPQQTRETQGLCPVCHKPLTIGVLDRVTQLADRSIDQARVLARKKLSVVPLLDILEFALGSSSQSKKVVALYHDLLKKLGNEFDILLSVSIDQIAKNSTPIVAQMIDDMRKGAIKLSPGYDGVYGKLIFDNV